MEFSGGSRPAHPQEARDHVQEFRFAECLKHLLGSVLFDRTERSPSLFDRILSITIKQTNNGTRKSKFRIV